VYGRCGALSTGSDDCPDWGTAARAVPDVLEEMVQRTLDEGRAGDGDPRRPVQHRR
jgi:hypothetical protein